VKSSNKEDTGDTPDVKRPTTNPSNPHDIENLLSWNSKQSRLPIFTHRSIPANNHLVGFLSE